MFLDPEVVTTPTVTKTTKSSSSFGAIGWGPVPGSVLPFVWGALAGLFFIAILMLIVIVCRKQCNKRFVYVTGFFYLFMWKNERNSRLKKEPVSVRPRVPTKLLALSPSTR